MPNQKQVQNSVPMQDIDIVLLARKINTHYSLSQIKQLCFELGVEFDDLDGKRKIDKSRELALEMRRQVRLPELVEKVSADRPNVVTPLHNEFLLPQTPTFYNRLALYNQTLRSLKLFYVSVAHQHGRLNIPL